MIAEIKDQGDFGFEWINFILIWGVTVVYPLWLIKGAIKWALRKWRNQ